MQLIKKQILQPAILPDYLLGYIKSGKFYDKMLYLIKAVKLSDCITSYKSTDKGFETKFNFESLDINSKENRLFIDLSKRDKGFGSFLIAFYSYKKNNGKNYLFSKNLVSILGSLNHNLKVNYLPNDFNGYIEMPGFKDLDGEEVEGIFTNIKINDNGYKIFHACYVTKHTRQIGYLDFSFKDKNKSIQDHILKSTKHQRILPLTKDTLIHETSVLEKSDTHYALTIMNAIIYLSNKENANVIEKNQFKGSKKAIEIQKKLNSHLPFIKIGEEIKLIRKQNVDTWGVNAHWRFQPCGPERSQIKLIMVKAHERGHKK